MKMVDRQGAVHEVPDDQVQEAFQSGQFGFDGDASIPVVTKFGKVGTVDADKIRDSFARGTRIAMPEELLQAKYGEGIGNQAAAAGEAFGRGLSGGASDPLAIGIAKELYGEQAGEKVREHLAGEREANPITSTVGEGVGMVAPFLVPGGEALEAAGAAAKGGEVLEAGNAAAKALEGTEAATDLAKTFNPAATARIPALADEAVGAAAAPLAEGGEAISQAAGGDALGASLTPVEEAAAAAGPGRGAAIANAMGAGLRGAGAVPRGIAGAGELAERAIAKIVGTDASSAAGRAIQKITAKAGASAVEGALFGVGNEIDEAALGDEDLNGEKMLVAAEHGALLAGGAGALLTGGGMLAREIVGRASPMMKRLAGEQAWKAANPGKKLSEKAMLRAGGTGAVGQAALEHGVFDNASNVEELLGNAEKAVGKVGRDLGDKYTGSKALPAVEDIRKVFQDEAAKFEGKPLHGNVLRAIRQAEKEVLGSMVPEVADAVVTKHAAGPLSKEEFEALLKEHGPGILGDTGLQAKLGLEADAKGWLNRKEAVTATAPSTAAAAEVTHVPIQKLISARQAIQDAVYRGVRSNEASLPVEELRHIAHELGEVENNAMDRAAKEMGEGPTKAEMLKLKKDYQRLSLFKEALQNSNVKYSTNRNLSISDYLMAMGSIAAGHPIVGAAGALGNKVLRERGNAWAARALDKLSAIGAVERATSTVDREIDRGIASIFRRGERALPRVRNRILAGRGTGDYDKRVATVAKATAYADVHADHVATVAASMQTHTPGIAKSFQRRALSVTSYLASKIPQGHLPANTLAPHVEKPRVSDMEKAKFNRAFDMANDPVGTTFGRMQSGLMTKSDADNLREMYPKLYSDIKQRAVVELSQQTSKVDFGTRIQIGIAFDLPAEQAIEPLFLQTMQATFAPEADNKQAPDTTQATPKRELKKLAETTGLTPGLADIE